MVKSTGFKFLIFSLLVGILVFPNWGCNVQQSVFAPESASKEMTAGSLGIGSTGFIPFHEENQIRANKGNLWISWQEIQKLPMSGAAWDNLLAQANKDDIGSPNLADQNQDNNVFVLAKALVYVRTGEERYRQEVIASCMAAIGTEQGGRVLSLARELPAYVIAADLVGLDPEQDAVFSDWLRGVLTENLDGLTLTTVHETYGNNWGCHAGAARAAVAVYLGDMDELARVAQVFKGWLGDRSSYAGFHFHADSRTWIPDTSVPVCVNPAGATIDGISVDGVLTQDIFKGGEFQDPPAYTGYVAEALQGVMVQANILSRQGYDVWNWSDQAIRRAFQYLYNLDQREPGWWPHGDDRWLVWMLNDAYGTDFPAALPAGYGKNMGWTDWTCGTQ